MVTSSSLNANLTGVSKRASLRCLLLVSGSRRERSLLLSYGNSYWLPRARMFCSYCSALYIWRDPNLCLPYSDILLRCCPIMTSWGPGSHQGTGKISFTTTFPHFPLLSPPPPNGTSTAAVMGGILPLRILEVRGGKEGGRCACVFVCM